VVGNRGPGISLRRLLFVEIAVILLVVSEVSSWTENVRYEVLTSMSMDITFFWAVELCKLVERLELA
jgi:hypothetical protein